MEPKDRPSRTAPEASPPIERDPGREVCPEAPEPIAVDSAERPPAPRSPWRRRRVTDRSYPSRSRRGAWRRCCRKPGDPSGNRPG